MQTAAQILNTLSGTGFDGLVAIRKTVITELKKALERDAGVVIEYDDARITAGSMRDASQAAVIVDYAQLLGTLDNLLREKAAAVIARG